MLPDLHPDIDGNIVADNIKAVQASYFAHQLENMRAFEVVDRIVELFQQGLLSLGTGKAGRLLTRYASTADRLAASRERDDSDDETRPTDCLALPSPSVQLWALASELVRIMGIDAMLRRRGSLPEAEAQTHPHGMVALFCGPAGKGKTLGAHALAAALSRDLVRVDVRLVVGKYVGETEKNLDAVLARVEHTGALLLLDEADALFGKRTDVQDSHDRYANSETGYLLQRLQAHQGMVIPESKVLPAGGQGGSMAGLSHVVQFPR